MKAAPLRFEEGVGSSLRVLLLGDFSFQAHNLSFKRDNALLQFIHRNGIQGLANDEFRFWVQQFVKIHHILHHMGVNLDQSWLLGKSKER